MDSLSLYRSFCKRKSAQSDRKIYEQVDQMIACIYTEIFAPPFETISSPFFCAVAKMMSGEKRTAREVWPSVIDTYVILSGLCEYIHDQSRQTTAVQGRISEALFCRRVFSGDPSKAEAKIIKYMNEIHSLAKEAGNAYKREQDRQNAVPESPADQAADREEMPKAAPKLSDEPVRDREERSRERAEQIRKWHEEQEKMNESLQKMQPAVRELLEGFVSLSDRITENYVLQFARQQIELYDLIADAYDYHRERAAGSGHADYENAVQNYEEYLYAIADALAAFGVEEILSAPGTAFDGGIHEADGAHFSSRNAVVAGSVRSGFRYGDLVLRREKVRV